MRPPTLTHDEDGGLRLAHLAPWFVSAILELPDLLDPDQSDEVKRRLYPEPSEDPAQSDEWKKYVHPDLFALLASAREIVCKDLEALRRMDDAFPLALWELSIPDDHVNAWISGLNAGRLTLATRHGIDEEAMDRTSFLMVEDPDDVDDASEEESSDDHVTRLRALLDAWEERRIVLQKIDLLGGLQEMIIEDRHPPPVGPQIPDSLPDDF